MNPLRLITLAAVLGASSVYVAVSKAITKANKRKSTRADEDRWKKSRDRKRRLEREDEEENPKRWWYGLYRTEEEIKKWKQENWDE